MRVKLACAPTLDQASAVGTRLSELLSQAYDEVAFRVAVELAAVELLSNVVRHGAPRHAVRLHASLTRAAVALAVFDDGPAYDFAGARDRLPGDPLAEHGRGLALIGRTADSFRYRRFHGINVHWFVKRRRAPG